MDPPSPQQVPKGPRTRAPETEVTSLLAQLPYESCETWLLPQASVLCVLRCEGDRFGEEREGEQVPKATDELMHREGQKGAPGPGHPAPDLPACSPLGRGPCTRSPVDYIYSSPHSV